MFTLWGEDSAEALVDQAVGSLARRKQENNKQHDQRQEDRRTVFQASGGTEVRGSLLILLVSVLFPATMAITFTLAVAYEHVYPIMPFMSYTGDLPVESCIFSLGLNLVATFYFLFLHIRYNQVLKYSQEGDLPHVNTILRLNRNSLPWGIASTAGLSVTGSFQELHLATVHRLGALTCTYCGFIYMWYQTILSDLLMGRLNSRAVFYLRTALSITSTTIHVVAPVLVAFLDLTYPKHHLETLVWSIEEEGWPLHVCCSFMEWIIFFINVTYISSFYSEFKHITIKRDEIIFLRDERHQEREATGPSGQSGPKRKKQEVERGKKSQ